MRKALLAEHGIEIAGGLGPLMGQIWRIGLMGYVAQPDNVRTFLAALAGILSGPGLQRGRRRRPGRRGGGSFPLAPWQPLHGALVDRHKNK